jgi:F-type H+-transporting ATPase subunit delta
MTAATVPAVYAQALLELAIEAGVRDQVVAEASELAKALQAAPDLLQAIDGPELGRDQDRKLLDAVFGGRVHPLLTDLLKLLAERGRFRAAPQVMRAVTVLARDAAGERLAEVSSAVELNDANKARVEGLLSAKHGAGVQVRYRIDPALIGGLEVRLGDTLVDASLRRFLEDLHLHLKQAPVDGLMTIN